jgi:hypothetical protein
VLRPRSAGPAIGPAPGSYSVLAKGEYRDEKEKIDTMITQTIEAASSEQGPPQYAITYDQPPIDGQFFEPAIRAFILFEVGTTLEQMRSIPWHRLKFVEIPGRLADAYTPNAIRERLDIAKCCYLSVSKCTKVPMRACPAARNKKRNYEHDIGAFQFELSPRDERIREQEGQ